MVRKRKPTSWLQPSTQGSTFGANLKTQTFSPEKVARNNPKTPPNLAMVQAALEVEFCPALDSSLVAAILSESDLSKSSIDSVRQVLSQLSLRAERTSEDATAVLNDYSSTSTPTSASLSTFNVDPDSMSSASSQSVTAPLAFLQAAFPGVATPVLQDALDAKPELDMTSVVEGLLSSEFLREEAERDSDSPEESEVDVEAAWRKVEKWKGKQKEIALADLNEKNSRPKSNKRKSIPVVDLRQRQYRLVYRGSGGPNPATDPWTHLSSLSVHLPTLIPGTTSSSFLSLFHSDQYPNPATALRTFLGTKSSGSDGKLSALIEVLGDEISDRRLRDAELCSPATRSMEDALDLVWLLRDLDDMGDVIIHWTPEPSSPGVPISRPPAYPRAIPSPTLSSTASSPASPRKSSKPKDEWTVVSPRVKAQADNHYLSEFIPAYHYDSTNLSNSASSNNNNNVSVDNVDDCNSMAREYRRRRDEALREASRQWQLGRTRNRGGEVALHYAEEARTYEERSRDWALRGARALVKRKQEAINDAYTLDLHGLTLHESYTIVREGVNKWYSSAGSSSTPLHPLNIITGMGKHSKGRVGVLAPAMEKMLEREGWVVKKGEGKLVVVGLKGGS